MIGKPDREHEDCDAEEDRGQSGSFAKAVLRLQATGTWRSGRRRCRRRISALDRATLGAVIIAIKPSFLGLFVRHDEVLLTRSSIPTVEAPVGVLVLPTNYGLGVSKFSHRFL